MEESGISLQAISVVGSLLVALTAMIITAINNYRTLKKKGYEEEAKDIYKKLNEFYGPLLQWRGKSSQLYDLFAERLKKTDPDYRTLIYLLKYGHSKFNENELKLLNEIIEIGKKIEELIVNKAGLVDDEVLAKDYLPKLSAHILILRLAYLGVLKDDEELFNTHVFPRDVDKLINEKIQHLQKRLEEIKNM